MNIPQDGYWKHVGNFGVDAGLCWIGDPCYILHQNKLPKTLGKDWSEFCELTLEKDYPLYRSFNYEMGHEGLGVCVSTGWGDGFYPVYARILNGRIMQIFIDFDGEVEDEDIYEKNIEMDGEWL